MSTMDTGGSLRERIAARRAAAAQTATAAPDPSLRDRIAARRAALGGTAQQEPAPAAQTAAPQQGLNAYFPRQQQAAPVRATGMPGMAPAGVDPQLLAQQDQIAREQFNYPGGDLMLGLARGVPVMERQAGGAMATVGNFLPGQLGRGLVRAGTDGGGLIAGQLNELPEPQTFGGQLMESVPGMAGSIGVGLATAGAGPALALGAGALSAGAQQGGGQFADAYDRTMSTQAASPEQAANIAGTQGIMSGAVSALTSVVPMGAYLGKVAPNAVSKIAARFMGDRLASRLLVAAAAEGSQEATEQVGQMVAQYLAEDDPAAFENWKQQIALAAAGGAILGPAGEGFASFMAKGASHDGRNGDSTQGRNVAGRGPVGRAPSGVESPAAQQQQVRGMAPSVPGMVGPQGAPAGTQPGDVADERSVPLMADLAGDWERQAQADAEKGAAYTERLWDELAPQEQVAAEKADPSVMPGATGQVAPPLPGVEEAPAEVVDEAVAPSGRQLSPDGMSNLRRKMIARREMLRASSQARQMQAEQDATIGRQVAPVDRSAADAIAEGYSTPFPNQSAISPQTSREEATKKPKALHEMTRAEYVDSLPQTPARAIKYLKDQYGARTASVKQNTRGTGYVVITNDGPNRKVAEGATAAGALARWIDTHGGTSSHSEAIRFAEMDKQQKERGTAQANGSSGTPSSQTVGAVRGVTEKGSTRPNSPAIPDSSAKAAKEPTATSNASGGGRNLASVIEDYKALSEEFSKLTPGQRKGKTGEKLNARAGSLSDEAMRLGVSVSDWLDMRASKFTLDTPQKAQKARADADSRRIAKRQDEWYASPSSQDEEGSMWGGTDNSPGVPPNNTSRRVWVEQVVKWRRSEGLPIPEKMLADYPDLARSKATLDNSPNSPAIPDSSAKAAKEPWEMTVGEWAMSARSGATKGKAYTTKRISEREIREHKSRVQMAVIHGKPVPSEVLDQYPDLKDFHAAAKPDNSPNSKATLTSSPKSELPPVASMDRAALLAELGEKVTGTVKKLRETVEARRRQTQTPSAPAVASTTSSTPQADAKPARTSRVRQEKNKGAEAATAPDTRESESPSPKGTAPTEPVKKAEEAKTGQRSTDTTPIPPESAKYAKKSWMQEWVEFAETRQQFAEAMKLTEDEALAKYKSFGDVVNRMTEAERKTVTAHYLAYRTKFEQRKKTGAPKPKPKAEEAKKSPTPAPIAADATIEWGVEYKSQEPTYKGSLPAIVYTNGEPGRRIELMRKKYGTGWDVREQDGYTETPMGTQKIAKAKYLEYGEASDLREAKAMAEDILRGRFDPLHPDATHNMRPMEEADHTSWFGNTAEDGSAYVTDGRAMLAKSAMNEKGLKRLAKPKKENELKRSRITDEMVASVLETAAKEVKAGNYQPATVIGWTPSVGGTDTALLASESRVEVLQVGYVQDVLGAVGKDASLFIAKRSGQPTVVTKGDKPVALIMPMSNERFDIDDVERAKATVSERLKAWANQTEADARAKLRDKAKKQKGKMSSGIDPIEQAETAYQIGRWAAALVVRGGVKVAQAVYQIVGKVGPVQLRTRRAAEAITNQIIEAAGKNPTEAALTIAAGDVEAKHLDAQAATAERLAKAAETEIAAGTDPQGRAKVAAEYRAQAAQLREQADAVRKSPKPEAKPKEARPDTRPASVKVSRQRAVLNVAAIVAFDAGKALKAGTKVGNKRLGAMVDKALVRVPWMKGDREAIVRSARAILKDAGKDPAKIEAAHAAAADELSKRATAIREAKRARGALVADMFKDSPDQKISGKQAMRERMREVGKTVGKMATAAGRTVIKAIRQTKQAGRAEAAAKIADLRERIKGERKRQADMRRIETRGAVDAAKDAARDQAAMQQGYKDQLVRLIRENMPRELRGKYLTAVRDVKTLARLGIEAGKLERDLLGYMARKQLKEAERLAGTARDKAGLERELRDELNKALGALSTVKRKLRGVATGAASVTAATGTTANAKVSQLSAEDLREVIADIEDAAKTIASVRFMQDNMDNVRKKGEVVAGATIRQEMALALASAKDLPAGKDTKIREAGWLLRKLRRRLNWDSLTVMLDGGKGSGPFRQVFNAVRKGREAALRLHHEFQDKIGAIVTANGYDSMGKMLMETSGVLGEALQKTVTANVNGEPTTMTLGQAMYLYASSKDVGFLERIRKGQKVQFVTQRTSDPVTITEADLASVARALTAKQRKMVDELKAAYDEHYFEKLSRTNKDLKGVFLDKVEGYWGIKLNRTMSEMRGVPTDWRGNYIAALEEAGFMQEREGPSQTPILIGDFGHDILTRSRSASGTIAKAATTKMMMRTVLHPEMVAAITAKYGQQTIEQITRRVAEWSGGTKYSTAGQVWKELMSMWSRAKTQLRFPTWLRNAAGGSSRMLAEMGVVDVASTAYRPNPAAYRELMQFSPIARERWAGGSAGNFYDTAGEDFADESLKDASVATMRNLAETAKGLMTLDADRAKVGGAGMWKSWKKTLDAITIGNYFDAHGAVVAYRVFLEKAPKDWPEAKRKKWAAGKAMRLFERTANTAKIEFATDVQLDARENMLVGMMTAFTGDTAKAMNMVYQAQARARSGEITWGRAMRTIMALLVGSALSAAIAAAWAAALGKGYDRAKSAAANRFIQEAVSVIPGGGMATNAVQKVLLGIQSDSVLDVPMMDVLNSIKITTTELAKAMDAPTRKVRKNTVTASERYMRALMQGTRVADLAGIPSQYVFDAKAAIDNWGK